MAETIKDDGQTITFGMLGPDGEVTDTRVIPKAAIAACPHLILAPEHYRTDGTCLCDDPTATVMSEWGYTWKDGAWR